MNFAVNYSLPLFPPSQSRQNEKKYLFQNLLFLIIRVCNKGNAIPTNRCRYLSRLSNRAIIWKTELFLFFFLSRSRMMRNGRDFCASINPRTIFIESEGGGEGREKKQKIIIKSRVGRSQGRLTILRDPRKWKISLEAGLPRAYKRIHRVRVANPPSIVWPMLNRTGEENIRCRRFSYRGFLRVKEKSFFTERFPDKAKLDRINSQTRRFVSNNNITYWLRVAPLAPPWK